MDVTLKVGSVRFGEHNINDDKNILPFTGCMKKAGLDMIVPSFFLLVLFCTGKAC